MASQSSTSCVLRLSGIAILTSGRLRYSSSCESMVRVSEVAKNEKERERERKEPTHRLALAPALRAPPSSPRRRARWTRHTGAGAARHLCRLELGLELGRLERLALGGVARALRLDERLLLADALLVELAEALLGDPLVPAASVEERDGASGCCCLVVELPSAKRRMMRRRSRRTSASSPCSGQSSAGQRRHSCSRPSARTRP